MTDDGVRERHGMACRKNGSNLAEFVIHESDNAIVFPEQFGDRSITLWQARYLARKLYRLARRIEKRQEASE